MLAMLKGGTAALRIETAWEMEWSGERRGSVEIEDRNM